MTQGTALLVIDVQVAIMDGLEGMSPPAYRRDETLARIGDLLAKARAAKAPVLFVQHEEEAFPPMSAGAPGWAIHPAVAPRRGEAIVRKRTADSFYGTPLRAELDRLGVDRLVVAGAETHLCVDTTVRRALSLDYDVILAADAHTMSGGGDDAPLTPAQVVAHHNATLAGLPHPRRGVAVVPAAEIGFA